MTFQTTLHMMSDESLLRVSGTFHFSSDSLLLDYRVT